MLLALTFLALFSAALAIPFPFEWISWNIQSPFMPSTFSVDSPKDEIGWADPRFLGGRFIDVGFLSSAPTCPLTPHLPSSRHLDTENP
ncbi:hypothetical protein J3R82DRAFT_9564 [Butyriboletus roseoflavus]|nr:hypothetical protein J3R82DRAFT_9564 [Butyriboletus roseoflavus]